MNSAFYLYAEDAMSREIKKLNDFTDTLDNNTSEKEERIAEYKCAKYRFAAIEAIHVAMLHCNRLKDKLSDTHYLLAPFDNMIKHDAEFLNTYNNAPDERKEDVGLYYGMLAYANSLIAQKQEKLSSANDWEHIELNTYIEGYKFALNCIEEAFRKE